MAPIYLLLVMFGGWVSYLLAESALLRRHRESIPLRIAVTGTRGKTTVTRHLAAVLSQGGRSVLAKTTGSEATYLFPDGSVHEIRRIGVPSIIEQKRLLGRGARLGVDVVVAEVMSVHAENHRVEAQRILKPHLVLVTNFRVDHLEAHGGAREAVAALMALDVPPGARALVPEDEIEASFKRLVEERGGEVVTVPSGAGRVPGRRSGDTGWGGFGPNQDLVWEAARGLGVAEAKIEAGLRTAQDDLGALRMWRYTPGRGGGEEKLPSPPPPPWLLVNAFAANDPESTMRILDRIRASERIPAERCVGVLSLRADRGDRSLQWAGALEAGALDQFQRLFVAGRHTRALRYRVRRHRAADRIRILRPSHPAGMMDQLLAGPHQESGEGEEKAPWVLFGLGNFAGLGRSLVRYWRKVGEPYGI